MKPELNIPVMRAHTKFQFRRLLRAKQDADEIEHMHAIHGKPRL